MGVRTLVATAALGLVLAGCGGGSAADEGDPAEPGPTATTQPSDHPTEPSGPKIPGKSANDALTSFACIRGPSGVWSASGVVTNPSAKADYRVTVVVAPAGVTKVKGKRLVLPRVKKGAPTSFKVARVPAGKGDGAVCRAQVVRFDP